MFVVASTLHTIYILPHMRTPIDKAELLEMRYILRRVTDIHEDV